MAPLVAAISTCWPQQHGAGIYIKRPVLRCPPQGRGTGGPSGRRLPQKTCFPPFVPLLAPHVCNPALDHALFAQDNSCNELSNGRPQRQRRTVISWFRHGNCYSRAQPPCHSGSRRMRVWKPRRIQRGVEKWVLKSPFSGPMILTQEHTPLLSTGKTRCPTIMTSNCRLSRSHRGNLVGS